MSGWNSALFVTLGKNPVLYFFYFWFYYSTSHSNSIIIIHCRQLVPLQEGPHGIQHCSQRLWSHAPHCLLKGEPIAQPILPVNAGRSSHQPEPRCPQIHACSARGDCWQGVQGLHDLQDPKMIPELGMPSPVRSCRLPRPLCCPRRRRELRWRCDASVSPTHWQRQTTRESQTSSRGGRQRPADIANRGLGDVATWGPGEAHTPSRFQDFSHSSHLPRSPVQEGILTLEFSMIPYLKLCDLPSDIAGHWRLAMMS